MQSEYTYVAIFVLLGVFLLLTCWRLLRMAGNTIGQLRYESQRDRYQHQRIWEEKNREVAALRRISRRIDGQATKVNWDAAGMRAYRENHPDDATHEVFDSTTEFRNMDMRSPWGWPSSAAKRLGPSARKPQPALPERIKKSANNFFRSKQVIDAEVRHRQQRSIRALVEDRYGRTHQHLSASEVEWSKPVLPAELVREREREQVEQTKQTSQDAETRQDSAATPHLVSVKMPASGEMRRASGE